MEPNISHGSGEFRWNGEFRSPHPPFFASASFIGDYLSLLLPANLFAVVHKREKNIIVLQIPNTRPNSPR